MGDIKKRDRRLYQDIYVDESKRKKRKQAQEEFNCLYQKCVFTLNHSVLNNSK